MALADLSDWLKDFSGPEAVIFAKRLSANDTLAAGSHQAGPYIPKEFLFKVIPAINRVDVKNPDAYFYLAVDSHMDYRRVRAIYYNNKFHGNPKRGRNEARLTNFGGADSPLLDPDSTGSLAVFAFRKVQPGDEPECHVWISRHPIEEDLIEDLIGPVDPGRYVIWSADGAQLPLLAPAEPADCWLAASEMPKEWLTAFPSGAEIAHRSVQMRRGRGLSPDRRLLKRLECEYELFRSIEQAIELPTLGSGFETVDEFISRAQTVLQRRKSRAGRSLELQTKQIFLEERLAEGVNFAHQPESEPGKRPDFLFPSQAAYRDATFPENLLRMLAVKTTCKDRWRQVVSEADRVRQKHLLTLQHGVSLAQFQEMAAAGVQLVVPDLLHGHYPDEVRPHLLSLESFIADLRIIKWPSR